MIHAHTTRIAQQRVLSANDSDETMAA